MRVLYIADPGSVGGAAKALSEVVEQVKKRNCEPIVVTSLYDDFNKNLEMGGIKTIVSGYQSAMNTKSPYIWKRPLKYPYESLRYYLSLSPAVRRIEESIDMESIDIIHTNSARNDIGCILSKKYDIPHVMHIREFGQEDFNCCIYRPKYYWYLSKYTSKFLAISKTVAKSWIKKGLDEKKVQILYDGVDIEKIKVKSSYSDCNSNSLKMIIAGGVCEPKGQHIAIEAIGKLKKDISKNIFLDIAGWPDPRYVIRLKQMIKEFELDNQIRFLGSRDDLYDILKNYDIGLTCSKSEGFGRVTVEYMYAGLCAIGSDGGATPELINSKKTGIVFKYPDSKELSDIIEDCYRNKEKIATIGENAHNAAKWYSAKRNADEIYKVYQEILG